MKRALVTGSEGFIGKHLQRRLLDLDYEVIPYDLKNGYDVKWCSYNTVTNVDVVFHLAAQTDAQTQDWTNDAETNIMASLRLFDVFRDRVVYTSSSAVLHPNTPYGISKLAAEQYALLLSVSVCRLCNIFGPGGHGCIDNFRTEAVPTQRGDGQQHRTYCHVTDAVTFLVDHIGKPGLHILGEPYTFDLRVRDVRHIFGKSVKHADASPFDLRDGRSIPSEPSK